MRHTLRTLALGYAAAIGLAAVAQPAPPYTINVWGYVAGCTPSSYVTIQTVQGTQPAIEIDVPVQPNTCTFNVALTLDSYSGWIQASTACQGAVQTLSTEYTFEPMFPDSNVVWFSFNCGSQATDCNGVLNGPDMPGSPCNDGNPATIGDTWTPACTCIGVDSAYYDCEGTLNGPAVPGTLCDNPATGNVGYWTANCECADTTGVNYDCLGIPDGSNMPGTPCWIPGTNFIGTWDATCNCSSGGGLPCQAGFWVIQAYGQDSLPVPNEVWVWNLSTSSSAPMTYLWSFGDGTSSTDPYPTHTYSGNGPYLLCLTIADASGCTSTSCDSISIDENGMINGMVINNEANADGARDSGFTLNVQNPLTTSVSEVPALSSVALWPNPATDELNMALVALADGSLNVTLFDVNGREVRQENRAINAGRNQHRFDISELPAGLYTARATDRNGNSISLRFAK